MAFFQIELTADAEDFPRLHDVSTFLYDFNLLYEIVTLAVTHEHEDGGFQFGESAWSRDGRPLREDQRLHVVRLKEESPLELVAIIAAAPAAAAALWALVQTLDKVANWRLNRDLLVLQREKLRRELNQPEVPADIWKTTDRLGGETVLLQTVERLETSSLQITSFNVTVRKQLPTKLRGRRDSPA